MEHVYIFDFCVKAIYHMVIRHDEDVIEAMRSKGLNEDNCQWLISDVALDIETL